MQITLELPDDVAHGLEVQVKDLPLALLESFALEGYRSGTLTEEQVQRVLGYGTRSFLKEHGVHRNYGREDLDQDMETLHQLHEKEPGRG